MRPLLKGSRSFLLILLFVVYYHHGRAQVSEKEPMRWVDIGGEIQIYPAGFIVAGRTMFNLSPGGNLLFRAGYNFAQRQNFGEHDNEKGGGPGISAGYRYYLNRQSKGLFMAVRTGLWFMNIDWKDRPDTGSPRTGETFIMVVQPTLAAGYQYLTNNQKWAFGISGAFGVEWNVITNGEDVGQGGISILLLSITRRFD